jgi:glutaminase
MLNTAMIDNDPELVLDLYFKQCSVLVNCRDLATMAATLAAQGVNPMTGSAVVSPEVVRDMLSVMATCGMYDYAGQWAYDVGLPAKSGVSGMIAAVVPGQFGIAVYSPRLDEVGNSVRGIEVCRRFALDFSLHGFSRRIDVGSAIRRVYTSRDVPSKRIRSPRERQILRDAGDGLTVLELQGPLYFGAAERIVRRVTELAPKADTVILDFKRSGPLDIAASELLGRLPEALKDCACRLVMTELGDRGRALTETVARLERPPVFRRSWWSSCSDGARRRSARTGSWARYAK